MPVVFVLVSHGIQCWLNGLTRTEQMTECFFIRISLADEIIAQTASKS